MKSLTFLLLAGLLSASGCLDLHGPRTMVQSSKKESEIATAPARPPITEDEVTENNAARAAQALTEELNREERR
jgi:hypothetical protein